MEQFEYDVVGYWSEIKLDIVNQYAHKYTTTTWNPAFFGTRSTAICAGWDETFWPSATLQPRAKVCFELDPMTESS